MSLDYLKMFYSPIVYRSEARFDLARTMRRALQRKSNISSLVGGYRAELGTTVELITAREAGEEVYLEFYFSCVKSAAMLEWIKVKHVEAPMTSNDDRASINSEKLIESDFLVILNDLSHYLKKDLIEALLDLYKLNGKRKNYDRVLKNMYIDDWLVRVFRDSYDTFLRAQKAEAQRNISLKENDEFDLILYSSLATKFQEYEFRK